MKEIRNNSATNITKQKKLRREGGKDRRKYYCGVLYDVWEFCVCFVAETSAFQPTRRAKRISVIFKGFPKNLCVVMGKRV